MKLPKLKLPRLRITDRRLAYLFGLLFLFYFLAYTGLEQEYEILQIEYNLLSQDYNELYGEYLQLIDEYYQLSRDYNALQGRYDYLSWEYNECLADLNAYKEELNSYVSEVYDTFAVLDRWIALNTVASEDFVLTVTEGCEDGGLVNYPCIVTRNDLGYRPDPEGEPQLYTYRFVWDEGYGDCDDYSLFAMALINALADEGRRVEFCREKEGSVFHLYSDWIYRDCESVVLSPLEANMYCGDLPDGVGHCVIRVRALEGTYWVEPQTGVIYDSDPFDGNYYIVQTRDDLYFMGAWYSQARRRTNYLYAMLTVGEGVIR